MSDTAPNAELPVEEQDPEAAEDAGSTGADGTDERPTRPASDS